MRQIQKRNEPQSLVEWRAAHKNDANFGYGLIDADLRLQIRRSLVAEQGGICAYTGRWIEEETCHIEHPKPQKHCTSGDAVAYGNMLACVPAPNAPGLPYGAHKKGSWPDATQVHLFVSPLRAGCGSRFSFTLNGKIKPSNPADQAASETIRQIGLDHGLLEELRKAAIDKTLGRHGRGPASLDLSAARRRLTALETAERDNGTLEPFCFVLRQALARHINRVEAIRATRRRP